MVRARRRTIASTPVGAPLTRAQIGRAVALLLATTVLGWGAIAGAATGITRSSNPRIALRFDSDDAEALARLADQRLMTGEGQGSRQAEALALRSLEAQPLNPMALRVLGFVREADGRKKEAQGLVRAAAAMSRRETAAQLWLIESAVNRGDISDALKHYDIALRVSPSAQALLFPVLTSALSELEIQQGVGRFFRTRPSWLLGFLYHAIDLGEQPQDVASTIMRAGGLPRTAAFTTLQPRLLARLAATRRYAALRTYYESLEGADRALLSSVGLASRDFAPSLRPLAWQLTEDIAFDTARDDRKPGLQVYAAAGAKGVVARRILFLKPGSYRLESAQRIIDSSTGASAGWSISCLNSAGATPLWRSADLRPGASTAPLSIPANRDCPAYSLELEVAGGEDASGFTLAVDRLSLRPASAGA